MPLPKPKEDEPRDTFISRCMSNETMNSEFPETKQRVAVCMQIWRDKGTPKNAQTLLQQGEENGKTKTN